MTDVNMRILLSATSGNTMSVINGVSSALTGGGGLAGALAGVTLAGAGLAVGIGVMAVKAAATFQDGLTSLVTGAGEAQSNLKLVGDGMLDMAVKTGTGTKQLNDGMYLIESAGFHGAQGLTVLKAAAEGAKVGNADLGVVANATTTVLTDYHMSADQAASATSGLVATVAAGKTHLSDLSTAMSVVLPLASSVHVNFQQVGAAMATMTNGGETARHAAQMVAFVLRDLVAPSSKAQKSMKEFGLSAQEVGDTLQNKGLPAALQLIEDHVGKKFPAGSPAWNAAMKSIMGGATGLNAILELGGKNMQTFKGNVDSIGHAMQGGGKDVQGWQQVQGNFNFKMDQFNQVIQTSLIKLGQQLLPVLTKIADKVLPVVTSFANWVVQSGVLTNSLNFVIGAVTNTVNIVSKIVNFFRQNQVAGDALIGTLAGITVGIIAFNAGAIIAAVASIPALVVGFIAWAGAAAAAAIATIAATWPILLIVAGVALLVVGIMLLVQHWGQVTAFLQGIWARFTGWLIASLHSIGAFFAGIWNGIVSGLRAAWAFIVQVVQAGIRFVFLAIFGPVIAIGALFVWLYQHNRYFQALIDAIRNIVSAGLAWLQNAWSVSVAFVVGLWNAISKYASQLWSMVTAAIQVEVDTAWQFLVSIWTTASSWLSDKWNQFSTFASNAWQAVSRVFSSIWGTYISGPMQSLWSSFSGWFSNMASQAVTFGSNIIQGLINGIRSQIGAAGQAAQDVINNIKNFLGFHSPAKMGPGAELMTWGPGLVKGFSEGMLSALPTLDAAVNITANRLTPLAAPAPRAVGASSQGRGAVTVVHNHTYNIQTMARSRSEISRFVDMMEQEQGKRVRRQTAGYSSGGIF